MSSNLSSLSDKDMLPIGRCWIEGPQTCDNCPIRTCFGMSRAVQLWNGHVPNLVSVEHLVKTAVVFVAIHPMHI